MKEIMQYYMGWILMAQDMGYWRYLMNDLMKPKSYKE
jgi:hypothetical protein